MSMPGDTAHCLDFATRLQHVKTILQRSSTDYRAEVDFDLQKDLVTNGQSAECGEVQRPVEPCGQYRKESDIQHTLGAEATLERSLDTHASEGNPEAPDAVGRSTTMEQLTLGQISALLKERAELMAELQRSTQHSKHLEERVVYLEECLKCHRQSPDTSVRNSPELQAVPQASAP